MHIPIDIIQAVTAAATLPRPVTVTSSVGVTVELVHHDVTSQLGAEVTNDFFGYENETIELRGFGSVFRGKR